MKRFVIGDIHGGHKALIQCLERSKFDPAVDLLISLGDICDGWPEVNKVIDELLSIKNFKLILGNHDEWALRWMKDGWMEGIWTSQGGLETMESYQRDRARVPESHRNMLQNAMLFMELNNKLFVHGGVNPDKEPAKQDSKFLLWDRDLLDGAVRVSKKTPEYRYGKWDDIFVGHTTTELYKTLKPVHACNVWDLDTGGGWSGKLTIMDIDSHEYWQSDLVPDIYPHIKARRVAKARDLYF
jgi:serine/threonine protein phosphatase 1